MRTFAQAAELAPVFGLAGTLVSLSQLPAGGIGQGAMASDGTAESDLSGTSIVGSSDVDDIGSDINFRLAGGAQSAFDIDEFYAFDIAERAAH